MRRAPLLIALSLAAVVIAACSDDDAGRGPDGALVDAGPISVFDLRVGDCLEPDDDIEGELDEIRAVPCGEPHTHEVFALPEFPDEGGAYPGEADIQDFADAACLDAFSEYTGTDYLDSDLFFTYLHPSLDSWSQDDDRTVTCVIVTTGEKVTGSVRAGGTTTTTADDDEEDDEAD